MLKTADLHFEVTVEIQEVGALAELAYETVIAHGSSFSEKMTPFAQLEDDSKVWLGQLVEAAIYGGDAQGCYEAAHSFMDANHSWDYLVPFWELEQDHRDAFKVFHAVVVGAFTVLGVR